MCLNFETKIYNRHMKKYADPQEQTNTLHSCSKYNSYKRSSSPFHTAHTSTNTYTHIHIHTITYTYPLPTDTLYFYFFVLSLQYLMFLLGVLVRDGEFSDWLLMFQTTSSRLSTKRPSTLFGLLCKGAGKSKKKTKDTVCFVLGWV